MSVPSMKRLVKDQAQDTCSIRNVLVQICNSSRVEMRFKARKQNRKSMHDYDESTFSRAKYGGLRSCVEAVWLQ